MRVRAYVYEEGKEVTRHKSLDALSSIPENATVWIDIQSEEEEELATVAAHFGLHELTIEDCLSPGHSPKLEDYGKYLFMIFRGLNPAYALEEVEGREEDEEVEEEEYTTAVAIYLSENYMITHRLREVPWLNTVGRQVKQVPEQTIALGTARLAHRVIDVLIDRFTRGLTYFEELIDKIEDKAIESPESFDMSQVIELKRSMSTVRQIMRDQRVVISRLVNEPSLVGNSQLQRYFKDVEDHAVAIINTMEKQIDNLVGLRDVYFAMTNVRLGDIMRILAVITTIAVPLNLVVGLYGMNFKAIPLLEDPRGFWVILVAMLAVAILMLVFFRKKRWI